MANILAQGALWDDLTGSVTPPWNGTVFTASNGDEVYAGFRIQFDGPVSAGDRVAGTVIQSTLDEGIGKPNLYLMLQDINGLIYDFVEIPPDTLMEFDFEAVAANVLTFAASSEGGSGQWYALHYTITPAGEPPPGPCDEIGRATRAYVSAYDRARVQFGRMRRQERRCVVADFNGAIPTARSITSVTWRCTSPAVTFMSEPSISGRAAQVMVNFQHWGFGHIKATVTLDNGEIYNQAFLFEVRDTPWYDDATPIVAGPRSVTATA